MVQDLYLKISEPIRHIIQSELEAAKSSLEDLNVKFEEEYKLPSRLHLCQLEDRDVRETKILNYFSYSEIEASLQVDKKYLKITLKSEALLDALNIENVVENCKSRTILGKFSTTINDEKIRQFNATAARGREFLIRVTFRNIILNKENKELVPELTGLDQICFNKQDPELPPLKGVKTPMLQPTPSVTRPAAGTSGNEECQTRERTTTMRGDTPLARDHAGSQNARRNISTHEKESNKEQNVEEEGQAAHIEYVRNHPDLSRCNTAVIEPGTNIELDSDIQSVHERDGIQEEPQLEVNGRGHGALITQAPKKNQNKKSRAPRGRGYAGGLGRRYSTGPTTTSEDESIHQYHPRNKNPAKTTDNCSEDTTRFKELEEELKKSQDEVSSMKRTIERLAQEQKEQAEYRKSMQKMLQRYQDKELERINEETERGHQQFRTQYYQSRLSNQTEFLSLNESDPPLEARQPPLGFAPGNTKTPFNGTSTAKAVSTPAEGLAKTLPLPDQSVISTNPFDPNYVETGEESPSAQTVSNKDRKITEKVLDRSRRGASNIFHSTDSSGEEEVFFINPQQIDFDKEIEPVIVMLDGEDKEMNDGMDLIHEWVKKFDNPNQPITARVNDSILALMVKIAQGLYMDRGAETKDKISMLGKTLYKRWKMNGSVLERSFTQQMKAEMDKKEQECIKAGFAENKENNQTTSKESTKTDKDVSNDTVEEPEPEKPKEN